MPEQVWRSPGCGRYAGIVTLPVRVLSGRDRFSCTPERNKHEFDGEAGATAYGYSLNKPELKGGTGIGEVGVTFKPTAASDFSFDLGIQGYTGLREGVSGSVRAKWVF